MRLIPAAICLLGLIGHLEADEIRGKVVGIADGETIIVLDAANVHRARIALNGSISQLG